MGVNSQGVLFFPSEPPLFFSHNWTNLLSSLGFLFFLPIAHLLFDMIGPADRR